MTGFNKLSPVFSWLSSLEVALFILLLIVLCSIPGTFIDNRHAYYGSGLFILLLVVFSLNLLCCTVSRWQRLALSVLIIHLGVLLTVAGFAVRELTGKVATINVYEGEPANRFYLPATGQEVDLGFSLQVNKIQRDYYPVPLKIGVLKGSEKLSLQMVRTGESFDLPGYRIVVEQFEQGRRLAKLAVYAGNRLVGFVDTSDSGSEIAGFPYKFRLVAFQNPTLRQSRVELQVAKGNQPPMLGDAAVNQPLSLYGYQFYYVQNAYDQNGRIYAGIQIVKDPGRIFTFAGMTVAALGALLAAFRRLYGNRAAILAA